MFYQFPEITNISQVLPAIEGATEFIRADRGDHTVLNYVVMTPDSFPPVKVAGGSAKQRAERSLNNALRRECRGIIFDNATGDVLRRPFHKFFNLNQIDETHINKIDLSQPHDILEKLDGSMIVPYRVPRDGRVIWGTKMGDTDVCTPVGVFVKTRPEYLAFFEECERDGKSPIFEWMSRSQRIVIDHPEDRLVLTAIRDLQTGIYLDYETMEGVATECDIPVVQRFHVDGRTSIEDVLEYIRAQEGSEGVVIRFTGGHMIKIKSEWYCAIHGAKELITEEKNVVSLIIDEKIDDAKALVLDEDRDNLTRYERDFWELVEKYANDLQHQICMNKIYTDRKSYALGRASQDDDNVRVATFHFFDRDADLNDVRLFVIDRFIRPNVGNRTKFGQMKSKVLHGLRQYL